MPICSVVFIIFWFLTFFHYLGGATTQSNLSTCIVCQHVNALTVLTITTKLTKFTKESFFTVILSNVRK